MSIEQAVRELRERNEFLEARVAQLEAILAAPQIAVPREWWLTRREEDVMRVLIARPLATKEMILAGVYRDLGREEPELKIVDVFICKIRKKLRERGVEIETVWGRGYRLAEDVRRQLLDASKVASLSSETRVAA